MANNYTFDQISTVLNQIVADAQGRTASIATTPRSTADFVAMAKVALAMGTDPIMHSLNQLIAKSVFMHRPYTRTLRILDASDIDYGNAVRRVTPIFADGAQNSPQYNDQPADGLSTDQWAIKRAKVLQTIIVGAQQWQIQAPTVFVDQLKSAFRGPDELGQFLSAQAGEVQNEIEQEHEQLARMTAVNLIGAKIQSETNSVYHLLTEYNNEVGGSYTATTIMGADVFPAFVKWAYARINSIANLMRERSTLFHQALDGYTILRHTTPDNLRLLMYAPMMEQIKTMVMSGLYHNELLKLDNVEAVNFWQNINQPQQINASVSYLDTDGTINTATVAQDKVIGVLYDRDTMGVNLFNEGVYTSPLNARGKYYNTFFNAVKRHWVDQTCNAAVFLLD